MPKELLYPDSGDFAAAIGWDGHGIVQIGVTTRTQDSPTLAALLFSPTRDTPDPDAVTSYIWQHIGQALVDALAESGYVLTHHGFDARMDGEPAVPVTRPDRLIGPHPADPETHAPLVGRVGQLAVQALDAAYPCRSLWVDLDRQATNRAIRALRKGRDAAFGPDE